MQCHGCQYTCTMFSEFPTTSQQHLKNTSQISSFHQEKMVGWWPSSKGWKGIKIASRQSFVIIGYGVQKHREDSAKKNVQRKLYNWKKMPKKWLYSSQVKVSLGHDCSEMSKSYHGEIKRAEKIPVAKATLVRCINSLQF